MSLQPQINQPQLKVLILLTGVSHNHNHNKKPRLKHNLKICVSCFVRGIYNIIKGIGIKQVLATLNKILPIIITTRASIGINHKLLKLSLLKQTRYKTCINNNSLQTNLDSNNKDNLASIMLHKAI